MLPSLATVIGYALGLLLGAAPIILPMLMLAADEADYRRERRDLARVERRRALRLGHLATFARA